MDILSFNCKKGDLNTNKSILCILELKKWEKIIILLPKQIMLMNTISVERTSLSPCFAKIDGWVAGKRYFPSFKASTSVLSKFIKLRDPPLIFPLKLEDISKININSSS